MAKHNIGPKNGFWKGGRSIASNGYVLIRVGKNHSAADVRGYAYEHRLVVEKMIGRRLLPREQVHHKDGNKLNNSSENLELCESAAHHRLAHRKSIGLRRPNEDNTEVLCKCGCGQSFLRFDSSGRPRVFVSGHNQRIVAHV